MPLKARPSGPPSVIMTTSAASRSVRAATSPSEVARKGVQQALMLFARCSDEAPARIDSLTGALEQFSASGRAPRDELGDFLVAKIENVVEQENGSLGRREPLQDYKHGQESCSRFQARHSALVEVDRLRQAIAAALLASSPRRVELVQAEGRVTMVTRNAFGDSTSTSRPCQRSHASCTMSCARPTSPSMR